ncbi:lysoplasmalogenase [Flindersiella endophytica]
MNARQRLDKLARRAGGTARGPLGSAPVRGALAVAGLACAAGQLIGIVADIEWLRVATKPPLMLLLAGYTLSRLRREQLPAAIPLLAGLVLASGGDTALLFAGRTAFLIGLLLFAGTHLCYIVGCLGLGAGRTLRRRPWIAVLTMALYVPMAYVTWQRAGDLRWPLLGYGLLLFGTVAVAVATNWGVGIGAVLFAASDIMIGLRVTGLEFPHQDLVVMGTYVVAQVLIAFNWRPVPPSDGGR